MKYNKIKGLKPTSDFTFADSDKKLFANVHVLEPDIFRVKVFTSQQEGLSRTWTVCGPEKDVPWQGRSHEDKSPFSNPKCEIKKAKDEYEYITKDLHIRFHLDPLSITVLDRQGREICKDLDGKSYTYASSGQRFWHFQSRSEHEKFFGLGEKTGRLNRLHHRYRMHSTDAMGYDAQYSDPLYKHWPFFISWNTKTKTAYGIYYDQFADSVFDMGAEVNNYFGPYRYYQTSSGYVNYYFINGPSIPEVIAKFMKLTGRTVLPPRWMLGFLGSTMNYTEAFNSEELLLNYLKDCETHDIPSDGFHLSSGYSLYDGKRYVFRWNPAKVSNPKKLAEAFKEKGQNLIVNVKPALLTDHPMYAEVQSKGLFIGQQKKEDPYLVDFWGGEASFLDFTHPMAVAWWKRKIKDEVLNYGMAGVWNDNNEFDSSEDDVYCEGFGSSVPFSHIRPMHTLLMTRSSTEAQEEFSPELRPAQITRAGCPGIQRYASTWSGDNYSSWKALKYSIPIGSSMSISGMFNFGHDVGGFAGPMPSPELLTRWVQAGVFLPRFTMHSWNPEGPATEPWMYPQALPTIRRYIQMRYEYLPYLYSLFFRSHLNHEPIARPLFYDYPNDDIAFLRDFDYMCGPFILVAPVYKKDDDVRPVYLPQSNTKWWDVLNQTWNEPGQKITVTAALDQLPLFIREGAIIPTAPKAKHSSAIQRHVQLYPGQQSGQSQFIHYEDDGKSQKYLQGEYTELEVKMSWTPQRIDVTVNAKKGTWNHAPDWTFASHIRGDNRKIFVNQNEVTPKPQH